MGLNVQGIATSIKTQNIADLTKLIGLDTPTKIDTTFFENATSYNIEDNELFLTLTSNGTILTVGDNVPIHDIALDKLSINGQALKFLVGETAMIFAFDYYENGKLVRSVMNAEGENIQEEGEPLKIEETESDFTELIFGIMKLVSGDSIYTLEPDFESTRYQFFNTESDKKHIAIETPNLKVKEIINQMSEIKPWWKFW
jgi:hypothetical protein